MPPRKSQKQLYYKIGEACRLLDIQPYVLRYWETEFPDLSPGKSRSGQRVYGAKELNLIRRIKELLYDEGFTIAGAKKRLEAEIAAGGPEGRLEEAAGPNEPETSLDTRAAERLEHMRQGVSAALEETRSILALLDRKPPSGSSGR